LEAKRKQIIQAQVQLINYAMEHGYVYPRWKTVVNVMIEKEPGNAKIHRMRVIHLYKADYTFILGVKWRQMLYNSDRADVLHRGQSGERPGCDALTPVFMEELKYEISHASRKSLINFDNDAASCYDRIIPALASLIGRKHGIHQNAVFVVRQYFFSILFLGSPSNSTSVTETDYCRTSVKMREKSRQ
jgi:hypothetical protein